MMSKVDIPVPFVTEIGGKYAERKGSGAGFKGRRAFANLAQKYACSMRRRHYCANVTFIDDQIGQIIQTLKEKGMYENAIICYTADHGDMLGDHYHWRKTYAYEGSAKIPYIIKWPSAMTTQANSRKAD
ncbi:MAG: sulfatase-like hydrolase/transferase [Bacteroides fragilis]